MKKLLVLTAIFCLYFQTLTVSAATPDFSGDWELEISRSNLPETAGIGSMTLKVSQTAKEITIQTNTRLNVELGGGATKQGNAAKTAVYNLDETEKTTEIGSGIMAVTETRIAKLTADGKLSLTMMRGTKNEPGKPGMKTNETWELLDNGNTLKIIRYTETPRGGMNFELYFTKKSSMENAAPSATGNDIKLTVKDNIEVSESEKKSTPEGSKPAIPKIINGGVLNGKASSLPSPSYPPAARAVRASGAVNVQVTIDEQGKIISASAVSGHPLLRQAAEQAARAAEFLPTTLGGQPVQITGVIVYNFVP